MLNKIINDGATTFIQLNNVDLLTAIDTEDLPKVLKHKATLTYDTYNGYIVCESKLTKKMVSLHRIIGEKIFLDHKDRNKLNNRKSNLRIATATQQVRNQSKRFIPNFNNRIISKYKGVSFRKDRNKWRAYISTKEGCDINLGCFKTEVEAAKAYDKAAKKYFGEFVFINIEIV